MISASATGLKSYTGFAAGLATRWESLYQERTDLTMTIKGITIIWPVCPDTVMRKVAYNQVAVKELTAGELNVRSRADFE